MAGFVSLLDSVCPLFKPFAEAQKRDVEERLRLAELQRAAAKAEEEERTKAEAQKKYIQEALNAQTYHQFRAYAEQQFPGDPHQQETLVKQLQEQHYQQYMAQVQQWQQQHHQLQQQQQLLQGDGTAARMDHNGSGGEEGDGDAETHLDVPSNPAISPASMWTRKDVKEFKETLRKEGNEGVLKVGHGETVTVRVPTHEEGTCLFWEFATDNYDLAFGVFFEWTISESNTVSVQISEEEDEDEEVATEAVTGGEEKDSTRTEGAGEVKDKPKVDEIVPLYRRDCHEEVYAGSHMYPGRGVYLLKFDNSYSLWRSKTLYYRVYYGR